MSVSNSAEEDGQWCDDTLQVGIRDTFGIWLIVYKISQWSVFHWHAPYDAELIDCTARRVYPVIEPPLDGMEVLLEFDTEPDKSLKPWRPWHLKWIGFRAWDYRDEESEEFVRVWQWPIIHVRVRNRPEKIYHEKLRWKNGSSEQVYCLPRETT